MNNEKLNTEKAIQPPTEQELQEIVDHYKEKTAAVSDDFVMDMLDSPEEWHYLRLLKVADYRQMGKSWAILTAWKLGYMERYGVMYDFWTEEAKQRKRDLLDLIAAIGRDDIINYFYIIVANELYDSHNIPYDQQDKTAAIVEAWQAEADRKEQERKARQEQKDSIKKLINSIDSPELLTKISDFVKTWVEGGADI